MPSVLPSGIGNFRMQKERNITMENEKKEVPAVQALSDESMNAVAGGAGFIEENNRVKEMEKNEPVEVQWDSSGRAIQWKKGNETFHYECPHCGRKMHLGSSNALYCDPCDDYFYWSKSKYKVKD